MEKCPPESEAGAGSTLHQALEAAWQQSGVLSSGKKGVSGATAVQELGAYFEGTKGTIGPSAERLLKLLQSTLIVLAKKRLKVKWAQVIAGRWILHVVQETGYDHPGLHLEFHRREVAW